MASSWQGNWVGLWAADWDGAIGGGPAPATFPAGGGIRKRGRKLEEVELVEVAPKSKAVAIVEQAARALDDQDQLMQLIEILMMAEDDDE